jgi:rubrerythrin
MADFDTAEASLTSAIETAATSPFKSVQTYEQRVDNVPIGELIDASERLNKINKRNARTSMFLKTKFARKS